MVFHMVWVSYGKASEASLHCTLWFSKTLTQAEDAIIVIFICSLFGSNLCLCHLLFMFLQECLNFLIFYFTDEWESPT